MPKEREASGRERWLAADEIQPLQAALPAAWWPFYALLLYTGLRWGEAAGLLWGDVRLAERRITVSDRVRRLKNAASNRDVPIPEPLAQLLAAHRTRYPGGPADPVFPAPFDDYRKARRIFQVAALETQLHDGGRNASGVPRPNVTIHDLRHTFGVHCAQAGVPIVRLQKLLGHASPHMTLRYMKHARQRATSLRMRPRSQRVSAVSGTERPRHKRRWREPVCVGYDNDSLPSPHISPQ